MKRSLIIVSAALFVPFAVSAQTATSTTPTTTPVVLPSAGLVPGDFFYFLDRWGEDISDFFTFSPVTKARRALKHADERASELHDVLVKKGAQAPEAQQAKADFDEDVNKATTIVADEKAKGVDVSAFAKDINDEFDRSKEMLKEAYGGYYDDLKNAEHDLRDQLKEAVKAGDTAAQAEIQARLQGIADEQTTVRDKGDAVDSNFDTEQGNLDEALGAEQAAQSHIEGAKQAREVLLHEASVRGIPVDPKLLAAFDKLLAEAETALKAGDFETAKEVAKDAKEALREVRKDVGDRELEQGLDGMGEEMDNATDTPEMREPREGRGSEMNRPEAPERGGLRIRGSENQGMEQGMPGMEGGMPNPDVKPEGE